jgi:ribonuclease HI
MITIFTDGSSKGNPGPGGWGAIVQHGEEVVEMGGHAEHTTNNKMELMACIKALESLPIGVEATLYSDATYVVKGITEWIHGWMKNSWKTSQKKPVENKELWMDLYQASVDKKIHWRIVAGHAGISANERCDVIATTFADGERPDLYNGSKNEYTVSLTVNGEVI